MGVAGTILAAKAISGVDVDRVLDAFDFGPPEAENDGWFISQAQRDGHLATAYFQELVDALGGPTYIVKVLADDWAYLFAAAPGSEPIALVLTPDALRAELGAQSAPAALDQTGSSEPG